jgi:hypothetical protein
MMFCSSYRDVIVLFQSYGDMRIFLTGKEETDELLCKTDMYAVSVHSISACC